MQRWKVSLQIKFGKKSIVQIFGTREVSVQKWCFREVFYLRRNLKSWMKICQNFKISSIITWMDTHLLLELVMWADEAPFSWTTARSQRAAISVNADDADSSDSGSSFDRLFTPLDLNGDITNLLREDFTYSLGEPDVSFSFPVNLTCVPPVRVPNTSPLTRVVLTWLPLPSSWCVRRYWSTVLRSLTEGMWTFFFANTFGWKIC